MDFIPGARAVPGPEAEVRRLDAARTWQPGTTATVGDFLDTVREGDEITVDGASRRVASVSRDKAAHASTITLDPGGDA